jgi:hypothetical protein
LRCRVLVFDSLKMSSSAKPSDHHTIGSAVPRAGNSSTPNSINPDGSKGWLDNRTKKVIGWSAMTFAVVAAVTLIVVRVVADKDRERDEVTLIK